MALERPTIGCRGQGPSDFITDGTTGYLVEPNSAESIRDVLQAIIDDPCDAARVAAAGRSKVFAQLTWRQNAATMLNLYQSLIARKTK
jgi:glycosyltransferase involved in cell wall biosynthesis